MCQKQQLENIWAFIGSAASSSADRVQLIGSCWTPWPPPPTKKHTDSLTWLLPQMCPLQSEDQRLVWILLLGSDPDPPHLQPHSPGTPGDPPDIRGCLVLLSVLFLTITYLSGLYWSSFCSSSEIWHKLVILFEFPANYVLYIFNTNGLLIEVWIPRAINLQETLKLK